MFTSVLIKFLNRTQVYSSVAFLLLTASCGKNNCDPKPTQDCLCITLYDPVCGCDDVTYGNDCEANCAGVTFKKGECKN